MNRKKARDELFETLGVNKQLDEYPKLANWATVYVKAASLAGEDLNFDPVADDAWYSSVAGTIRLVCDIWPYCEWSTWLTWQRYDGPRRRGPWWIANFDYPPKWNRGIMILRNPWRFAFSELLMASDQPGAQFEFHTPRKARLSESKHEWLAGAVLDGVRYDFDDDEFFLVCSKHQRSLEVEIWDHEVLSDQSHREFKRDADGILWDLERSKQIAKTKKSKKVGAV